MALLEQMEEDLVELAGMAQDRGQVLEAGLQADLLFADLGAEDLDGGAAGRR